MSNKILRRQERHHHHHHPGLQRATLLAEWPLTPDSVSASIVEDFSGNGNTATIVNGPLPLGVGATFDGGQHLDSWLQIAGSSLSVSCWFNATSLVGMGLFGNPRLVCNSHTDIDSRGFQLMFNTGGGDGYFDIGDGATETRAAWSQQLATGIWYHYAGTYDGETVVAYLNGVQVATASAGGMVASGTGPNVSVARNVNGDDYFVGTIYDVRIYDSALSADEILQLYQTTKPR